MVTILHHRGRVGKCFVGFGEKVFNQKKQQVRVAHLLWELCCCRLPCGFRVSIILPVLDSFAQRFKSLDTGRTLYRCIHKIEIPNQKEIASPVIP